MNLVKPACVNDKEDDDNTFFFEQAFSCVYEKDIQASLEFYLNLPDDENTEQNLLSFHHIREQQQADAKMLTVKEKFPQNYIYKGVDNSVKGIICYIEDFHDPMTQWKISLPESMLNEMVN
eukprot:10584981-Ditylum_brightwellii.AAC.1